MLTTGVRYAKPPVGKLRFKKTEEAEGWKGVQDAKAPGSICPQIDPGKKLVCYYLLLIYSLTILI